MEDFTKKTSCQDLKQEFTTPFIKEITSTYNTSSISFENLNFLLFLSQKAISDLKLLKSLFYHRKNQISSQLLQQMGVQQWGSYNRQLPYKYSQYYWNNLNSAVKVQINKLSVNPLKLDRYLQKMIDKSRFEDMEMDDQEQELNHIGLIQPEAISNEELPIKPPEIEIDSHGSRSPTYQRKNYRYSRSHSMQSGDSDMNRRRRRSSEMYSETSRR